VKHSPPRRRASALVLLACIGAASATADELPPEDGAELDAVLAQGSRIFHRKCVKCHGSGRSEAPALNRPGEWAGPLQQPLDVLIDHALYGHQGSRGRMPPKGNFDELSDDDVVAAVHYIWWRGRWLTERMERASVACPDDPADSGCVPPGVEDRLLLRFLWMLRSTGESR
jgi:cytochrome c5